MKKVLFDLAALHTGLLGSVHGGGVYAEVVFKRLLEMSSSKSVDVFYFSHKQIDSQILDICKKHNVIEHKITKIENIQPLINSGDYHTLYSALPYELYSNIDTRNIRFVYTIHGLRELEVPYSSQQWRYSLNWKRIVEWLWGMLLTKHFLNATTKRLEKLFSKPNSVIITISNHSKYSILNFFSNQVRAEQLKVFYSPLIDIHKDISEPQSSNSDQYFLLVNGNRWIKNNYRALNALLKFYSLHPQCKVKTLVLGMPSPPAKFSRDSRFIFKGYVSRIELDEAYQNAFAFIYPTLNEGFGYPPLEAMRLNTPVLSSSVSAIPEICGNAVLYFNPFDENEIVNRIAEIYFDDSTREILLKRGKSRYQNIAEKQNLMLDDLCSLILSNS